MTTRILLATFVMLTAACGCSTIDTNWIPKAPWNKKDKLVESQFDTPIRMAAIWTPDIMVQPGMPASRGFGGRLYFYNQANKPVKVEGQLVVYAYDDTAEESQRESPDRKYAFTPAQFINHHSESELGASYSVWLPWDTEASGDQKSISLLPVFTSTAGKIVMGQQALNLLPGKKPEPSATAAPATALSQTAARGVRPAAFQENRTPASAATEVEHPRRPSMKTTTIDLPQTTQQRIIEAAQNQTPISSDSVNPVLLERAKATLEQLRANSARPTEAEVLAQQSPATRFAPPRPRVPSSPTSQSTFSHAPSRPVQPARRFDPPSSPIPNRPMATGGFELIAE